MLHRARREGQGVERARCDGNRPVVFQADKYGSDKNRLDRWRQQTEPKYFKYFPANFLEVCQKDLVLRHVGFPGHIRNFVTHAIRIATDLLEGHISRAHVFAICSCHPNPNGRNYVAQHGVMALMLEMEKISEKPEDQPYYSEFRCSAYKHGSFSPIWVPHDWRKGFMEFPSSSATNKWLRKIISLVWLDKRAVIRPGYTIRWDLDEREGEGLYGNQCKDEFD
ncbi:hypothetical protein QBC44DRAFT_372402 [Cladorrhinum sp. PSN332]|nr:hypothetical protein QBC44DRAFT_372402 [Cladorrhinum sp. PSN332]